MLGECGIFPVATAQTRLLVVRYLLNINIKKNWNSYACLHVEVQFSDAYNMLNRDQIPIVDD